MSEAQLIQALDTFTTSKYEDKDTGYEGKRVVLEMRHHGKMPEDALALRQIALIGNKFPELMRMIHAALAQAPVESEAKSRLSIMIDPKEARAEATQDAVTA